MSLLSIWIRNTGRRVLNQRNVKVGPISPLLRISVCTFGVILGGYCEETLPQPLIKSLFFTQYLILYSVFDIILPSIKLYYIYKTDQFRKGVHSVKQHCTCRHMRCIGLVTLHAQNSLTLERLQKISYETHLWILLLMIFQYCMLKSVNNTPPILFVCSAFFTVAVCLFGISTAAD